MSNDNHPPMRLEAAVDTQEQVMPDPELEALREEWSPQWSIWRARRIDDPPGTFSGELVATRLQDTAGADRTVMRPTAAELDAALRQQEHLAARDGLM